MPRVPVTYAQSFREPAPVGPVAQCDLSNLIPPTLAAGGSYDSGILYADGFKVLCAGVKMDQAGTITISRYLDAAGLIPVGNASTMSIVANTAVTLTVNDNVPFLYVRFQIANTGGVAANVAAAAAFMNAN